jgi:hypothetical protein
MILKDLIVEGARTAISCRHRGRMGFDTMGESVERETEIEDGDGDEGEEREEEEEEEEKGTLSNICVVDKSFPVVRTAGSFFITFPGEFWGAISGDVQQGWVGLNVG